MALVDFKMPKMGDGMEEGTVTEWLKKEGEPVKNEEAIAKVETDKANVDIAATETGTLSKIIVQVGQTVPVGGVIAQIDNGKVAPVPTPEPPKDFEDSHKTTGTNGSNGTGGNGHEKPSLPTLPSPPGAERVKASPLVRAIAKEKGLALAEILGSGPGGRIVQRDVVAYLQTLPGASTPPPVVPPTPPVTVPVAFSDADTTQEITPSNMRKAIAKRTAQSKQNIPHFYVTMLVEMDRALALLKELNADANESKITVNDIIVKACARSLAKVPEVNSTWTPENTVKRYAHAHIGIAVGIDDGLIIPVVRDCHKKSLRDISAEAKQLIVKAKNNQLKPEEYQGGTFSVSNLGMMGVDEFIAIINPPEAAILAIGGIAREPVVAGNTDEIVIRSRMKITISADHRLLDGVVAARFLQEVKKALEAPFSLLS